MPSNYTGDSAEYFETLELPIGSDARTVSSVRVPLERLADNAAYLRAQQNSLALRLATSLRTTDAVFADTTSNFMTATCLFGVENCAGPVVVLKTAQSVAVYDAPNTEAYAGGAIPNLTSTHSAAVNTAGRIVVVGATTPFCAFKIPGGTWTAGGSEIGTTGSRVVYSPAYDGFIALPLTGTDVFRSTTAAAWTSAPSGLATGLTDVAVVGAGDGEGRIVVLGAAASPTVAVSTNDGASFSAGGAIPYAGVAQEAGTLSGCPVVTRAGLNGYVYHAARCNAGTEIRTSRSADGITWEAMQVFTAPTGMTFSSAPRMLVCKSTGLIVLQAPTQITSDAVTFSTVYSSVDFEVWSTPSSQDIPTQGLWAVAGGKFFMCPDNAVLYASDSIASQVTT